MRLTKQKYARLYNYPFFGLLSGRPLAVAGHVFRPFFLASSAAAVDGVVDVSSRQIGTATDSNHSAEPASLIQIWHEYARYLIGYLT